jgi:hypothetical protein
MTLLKIKPTLTNDDDSTQSDKSHKKLIVNTSVSDEQERSDYTSTEDLYPIDREFNPSLYTAIELLSEGINYMDESFEQFVEGDRISSDDSVQKFQTLLPELFCCRSLGDGFAIIVNSLFHMINNLKGSPLNVDQIKAIRKLLRRLHSEPFIDFEEATDELIVLEESGLNVITKDMLYIADLLNG